MGGTEIAAEQAGVPTRRTLRFSLRTLVLVAALLCTILSHVLTSFELHKLRKEARQLRDELGYLTITDKNKLHAIALSPDVGFETKRRHHGRDDSHRFGGTRSKRRLEVGP